MELTYQDDYINGCHNHESLNMSSNDQATEETELTSKQEAFIIAMLSTSSIADAAISAGIADKTARRWLKLAHVQDALKSAQKQVFNQALQGLMLRVDKAIETLDRNMDDELTPASTQVRSAQIILEQAIAIHRTNELEERIQELENHLRGNK